MKHISNYLEEYAKEMFEERSAIMEFCGNVSRENAESAAKIEVEEWRKRKERLDSGTQR